MNEASSKFVDKLAIEKLINEKLMKVKHSPDNSKFIGEDLCLESIEEQALLQSEIEFIESINGVSLFQIPSFYQQEFYEENNMISIYYYPSPSPQSNIILVHGLFDENRTNFLFLINQLGELNFNVFFMTLPYHFNRKPKESFFGGEYFFSADLYRTRSAFKQAVLDVEATLQFIHFQNSLPTGILGFSMGGCVAFQYYLLKQSTIKTFLINPVSELKRLAWDNTLLLTVGRDLEESSLKEETILDIFKKLDPCEKIGFDFMADNLAMVYSAYDQMIEKSKYDSFIKLTGMKHVMEYSSGHLNVLRVPRLARDINGFLNHDLR